MYKQRLCLGTSDQLGLGIKEQIKLYKKVGFDAFFTMWDEHIGEYKKLADEIGMIYQSVHAPFVNAAKMWKNDDEAKKAIEELLICVRDCSDCGVPILVVHPYIGFERENIPTAEGLENFRDVVCAAKANDVKIAFENVEGEEYLSSLMSEFTGDDTVGFCWDSGHEMCYNRGKDMLSEYGDRLIATHLNDNLGVRSFEGEITWIDDLHLLPGDGVIDWQNAVKRLDGCGYDGILTFELNKAGKPERHENDKYMRLSDEEYVTECYIRACKIGNMKRRKK